MEIPEGYHLFMQRLRRGAILFRILWLASIGLTGLALLIPEHRGWAIVSFSLGILLFCGMQHVRGRYISAQKVPEDPKLVYWVHATTKDKDVPNNVLEDCKSLTLHLRNGCQFDVDLPPSDIRTFLAWLKDGNPAVRCGNYDKGDAK